MAIERIDLPEKAPDRVYRSDTGHHYRMKVQRITPNVAKAAPNINPALVAPTGLVLSVSLAIVDEQGRVLKIGDKLRIADRHEIGPLNAGADLPALINDTIEKMIAAAEAELIGMPEAVDYLATEWGIDFSDPAPPPPFVNIPTPPREMTAADLGLPQAPEPA